jgi:transposase
MKVITIGLDIAKNVFQVHGVDAEGQAVVRQQLRRRQVLKFFAALEPCLVGLEACATSHYWARALGALGHRVRLIPPSYVKGFVKRGKSDAVDAEAICVAVSQPSMRFVPVKSPAQQAMMVSHRLHDMLGRQRTMLINLLRSQMAEFGITAPRGRARVADLVAIVHDPEDGRLPAPARAMLIELVATLEALAPRIANAKNAIVAAAREDPVARRLMTIPGVGPITAAAMVAMVGDPSHFRNGRHFAAWLGLVPKQNGTGGKMKLGRISKMGDRYLRKLLVLGATSNMSQARTGDTPMARWIRGLKARRAGRLVSVALANKTARIIWAVMASGDVYQPQRAAA